MKATQHEGNQRSQRGGTRSRALRSTLLVTLGTDSTFLELSNDHLLPV